MAEIAVESVGDYNQVNGLAAGDKSDGFTALLDKIISQSSPTKLEDNLTGYAALLIDGGASIQGVQASEPPSIVAARPLLSSFVARLTSLNDRETLIAIIQSTIRLLQPRVASFEEQDTALKILLADTHQANEDFTLSARALEQISLTTTQRQIPDSQRADIWIRIARCYLEDDDPTSASTFINRAKNILHNVPTSTEEGKVLHIQFKSAQARILDSQRQFLDAANAYHTLSFDTTIDEDDRLTSLTAAIVCAVLGPAGPARSRTLAKLYKDERAAQTAEHGILENIFLDRLLSPAEVSAFSAKLQPHQLARTADGSTVLERAVLEHNLLAASRLYSNISVEGLGVLLGTDGERAQSYAASMIEQRRLRGVIDEIDGMIFFSGATEEQGGDADAESKAAFYKSPEASLRDWDAAIQALLGEVESVASAIQTQHPDVYARLMV